jgi:hypothetical protein
LPQSGSEPTAQTFSKSKKNRRGKVQKICNSRGGRGVAGASLRPLGLFSIFPQNLRKIFTPHSENTKQASLFSHFVIK